MKQVSRELGVRYVLEGSVRRAGKRLRITAQLVDAMTGGHHWAERYDRELGDIFAVQDEITRSVAAAIEPHLLAAEGVRAFSRSADDLGAWELVARAQAHFWRMSRSDYRAGGRRWNGPSRPIRTTRRREACWAFAWCLRAHGLGRARQGLPGQRARRSSDRARRPRSVGTHRAGLLGDDGTAYRESIAAFRRAIDSIRIRPRPAHL